MRNSFLTLICLIAVMACTVPQQSQPSPKGKKESSSLTGTKWVLQSINNAEISASGTPESKPWLILNATEITMNGYSGCNNFFGQYTLPAGSQTISFGQVGATKMACEGKMELETRLFKALQRVGKYNVSIDILTLYTSDMVPLMTFRASAD